MFIFSCRCPFPVVSPSLLHILYLYVFLGFAVAIWPILMCWSDVKPQFKKMCNRGYDNHVIVLCHWKTRHWGSRPFQYISGRILPLTDGMVTTLYDVSLKYHTTCSVVCYHTPFHYSGNQFCVELPCSCPVIDKEASQLQLLHGIIVIWNDMNPYRNNIF